jgi:hypothetical protein
MYADEAGCAQRLLHDVFQPHHWLTFSSSLRRTVQARSQTVGLHRKVRQTQTSGAEQ